MWISNKWLNGENRNGTDLETEDPLFPEDIPVLEDLDWRGPVMEGSTDSPALSWLDRTLFGGNTPGLVPRDRRIIIIISISLPRIMRIIAFVANISPKRPLFHTIQIKSIQKVPTHEAFPLNRYHSHKLTLAPRALNELKLHYFAVISIRQLWFSNWRKNIPIFVKWRGMDFQIKISKTTSK